MPNLFFSSSSSTFTTTTTKASSEDEVDPYDSDDDDEAFVVEVVNVDKEEAKKRHDEWLASHLGARRVRHSDDARDPNAHLAEPQRRQPHAEANRNGVDDRRARHSDEGRESTGTSFHSPGISIQKERELKKTNTKKRERKRGDGRKERKKGREGGREIVAAIGRQRYTNIQSLVRKHALAAWERQIHVIRKGAACTCACACCVEVVHT